MSVPIIRAGWRQMLAIACPACPAAPGMSCELGIVPAFEGWHIARALAAERLAA